jgi:hypothetical protein
MKLPNKTITASGAFAILASLFVAAATPTPVANALPASAVVQQSLLTSHIHFLPTRQDSPHYSRDQAEALHRKETGAAPLPDDKKHLAAAKIKREKFEKYEGIRNKAKRANYHRDPPKVTKKKKR